MTPVYSGGLVYEYSEEGSGYGLVTINGNSVSEKPDFTNLMNEFKNNTLSGDGGYKSNGQPSTCPTQSSTWQVTDFTGDQLPALPSGAEQYMKNGAGTGPGLSGSGSQDAPGGSSATASAGSGAVTTTAGSGASGTASSSSTHSGAAVALAVGELSMAPFVCGAVVVLSTLFGATLL
jgi:1,3-beta-glucanosyltransferase GAS5